MTPIKSNHTLQKIDLLYFFDVKQRWRPIFLLLFFLFFSPRAYSQNDIKYSVHANIIYHFTKYVDWPSSRKNGDFIIAVIGDTPLYDELKKAVSKKKVGDQEIVIKRISPAATVFNCHILFISEEESASLKRVSNITKGNPILIVSETEGLAQKGSCINFIIVNEKLRLEINKANIEERNLNIASELLKLGVLVK